MTETDGPRPRRGLLGRAVAAVLLSGALALLLPPLEAAAAPEDLIVFDDDSSCEVRMQNIHASSTVAGDVSAAVDVRCHPPGSPRGELLVDEITAQTGFSFSESQPIPGLTDGYDVGTCERLVFTGRPSATLPCHQVAFSEGGWYIATSVVTVTLRGQTEEVQVSRQAFLGGYA